MRKLALTFILAGLLIAPAARADFGLHGLDVTFTNQDGSPAMQAGSHPFAMSTSFTVNTKEDPEKGFQVIDGALKDLDIFQAAGFVGDPTAVPRCETIDFVGEKGKGAHPNCADSTALGTLRVELGGGTGSSGEETVAIYNMRPAPHTAAKLGFRVGGVPITLDIGLNPNPPYNVIVSSADTSQATEVLATQATIWGNPADPAHDPDRGQCAYADVEGSCPANLSPTPFITLPRSCTGPLRTLFRATSWWSGNPLAPSPGTGFEEEVETHDDSEPPQPLGATGCSKLLFQPRITAQPTSKAASSPTGLDFSLDVADEGLTNPTGLAQSDIEKAVVTLPEGFSVNPSIAEGLAVCSEGQLGAESATSAPGAGCPNASKIGTVEVETPLLDENVNGALYQAAPYDNPSHSLIALYMVIKNPTLGIVVRQPLRVIPDPLTGRLTTVAEDLPQLPFSHFRLHFREGTRSPLVTPSACGVYDGHDPAHEAVKAELTPSSGGAPVTTTAAFEVISGPDGGPCPQGGLPPFHPALSAGTLNNAAGRFSPFNVRLSRSDSEQEITHFSIKLPPGIVGKLAGIPFCTDAAIAAAKARTGPHGGAEELNSPSCPAASGIGRTLVGSGVGPSLAYAPGKLYLAGPYHGAPISVVAITAGVVGPFDIGTVVVREALKIDPETAEVFIDSTGSDPIPHIIQGIPVHLRDIRAYAERPEFVLNPTSCARTSTASTLLGAGLDFGSEADDNPVTVSTPFQAADCASLGYKPRLTLKLKGGTKRGGHPALTAVLRPRPGDANSHRVSVALPHSEFLDQGHIGTVCTRVQFKAGAGNGTECPAASIYGHATAYTPILAQPLEGPVILRSSEHPLPDLVLALHGLVDFDAVGRIDSVKGGIRNTFEAVPDAPVSKVVVSFQGGKKGLLENSTDLCRSAPRATAEYEGQNGKAYDYRPLLGVKCKKGKRTHNAQKRPAQRPHSAG